MQWNNVPAALRERDQWVLWKYVTRDDQPTKVPVRPDGAPAKSNDPATWSTFDAVRAAFDPNRHAGPGFVFAAADPFVGIDLDGCRDPKTGAVADWAREVVLKFATYAEVSPSGTGVKLFARGKSPFESGRKIRVVGAEPVGGKEPAVEVYDAGRYFAVTGLRLQGAAEPTEAAEALVWLRGKFQPPEPPRIPFDLESADAVVERARKYLAKMPYAVSGQSGHNVTFRTACVLVLGFELAAADALALLSEWNRGCQPPWSEKDLERKVREAGKQPGERGYLRNVAPSNWSRVKVPEYRSREAPASTPLPKSGPKSTRLADAAQKYLDKLRAGEEVLASTSIPDLDYALGGGVGFGEMVLFAARPSHGKSAVALQCLHKWTEGLGAAPAVIVSEEMSELMLGKRTIQHITEVPESNWKQKIDRLDDDLVLYKGTHSDCFILEGCGAAEVAVEAIERHVRDDGVRYAVVDYVQLLSSAGKNRYEQVSNTSILLRQLASRTKIVLLVLAQLNRAVEQRAGTFMPVMSDLRDSGQLEQDADVIAFLCWPHKLDTREPKERYQFFLAKNRNRETRLNRVECNFLAARQMFRDAPPAEFGNDHREPNAIPT